jgi:hypothetical protein
MPEGQYGGGRFAVKRNRSRARRRGVAASEGACHDQEDRASRGSTLGPHCETLPSLHEPFR